MKMKLLIFSESLCSYTLVTASDRKWGVIENGTWSGMVGMLHRGEADLGLGPFSANLQRYDVAEFTNPLFVEHLTILLGKVKDENKPYSFLKTFRWEVWASILLALFVVCMVYCLIFLVTSKEKVDPNFVVKKLVALFGCICTQGMPQLPSCTSGRLLIGFWWIGLVILTNSFSGNIKAWLLFRDSQDRIQNLQDLLKFPDIIPIVEKGTSTEALFKTSEDRLYRKIWKRILQHNDSLVHPEKLNSDEVLDKVARGTHALISSEISIFYSLSLRYERQKSCNFYLAKEHFHAKSRVILLRRNSSLGGFQEELNFRMATVMESGFFSHNLQQALQNFTKCLHTSEDTSRPLKLEDVKGLFIMLSIGLILSLFALASEIWHNRAKTRKLKRSRRKEIHKCKFKYIF
ncbi:glutamate receptor ionotropic, kainate 1-like isoform X2 [Limulus polyphemus]|uniref:Glutamate receptor ionotropic, kainate 1-like isoform X2 n=1 Tax=Limulus polyphemus TaxID=6850 RepID=A0ABM1TMQ7_LIMPO|nr:glutamate receptor ionotropic, kainate 1-like isoform X2 [Limulus polyphemus]